MISGSIGRRYAKALFGLAVEQNRVEPWSDALRALKVAVDGSPELRDVLQNPVYTKDQRRAVATKLAEVLKLDAEPASLLYLLSDRNRLAYLDGIVGYFGELADAKLGRVRARVTTAVPVDAAPLAAISKKLGAATAVDRLALGTALAGLALDLHASEQRRALHPQHGRTRVAGALGRDDRAEVLRQT